MTLAKRLCVLRRCRSCAYEDETNHATCPECGDALLTVCYSILDGRRITSTFAEDQQWKAKPS